MNVSSTTALTRELNPPEAPFLPTNASSVFLAKISNFLVYFEDGLKTTEGVYEKSRSIRKDQKHTESQRNKRCLYNDKSVKGIKINVHTVIEQAYKVLDYE